MDTENGLVVPKPGGGAWVKSVKGVKMDKFPVLEEVSNEDVMDTG